MISILMPVYNGEAYLAQAIESVLAQTLPHWELLVLNDGSTDRSRDIALSYPDQRIRLIDNPQNMGLTPTLNRGLALAQGRYIARLDADDLALPERLAVQAAFMDKHPRVALCGSWIDLIDAQGQAIGENRFWLPEWAIQPMMLLQNCFIHSSVMMRAECVKGGYDTAYPIQEDYDFWVRLAKQYPLALLPQVLVKYRFHQASVTSTKKAWAQLHTEKIILRQLAAIGLVPTPAQLEMHKKLTHIALECSPDFLREAGEWLWAIAQGNARHGYFVQQHLEKILAEKWQKTLSFCVPLGAAMLRQMWANPLSRLMPPKAIAKLALLAIGRGSLGQAHPKQDL